MKWYKKYSEIFEINISNLPLNLVNTINKSIIDLQSENPLASVIIIGHNEESRILSCLWSVSNSKCSYPIEIICVDNSSTDKTFELMKGSGARTFSEPNKGPGFARNRGLSEAKGKYIICMDGDTIYPPHYIEIMIKTLQKPGIIAAFSLWSYIPDKNFPSWKMFIYEFLRDFNLRLLAVKRPERCVRGMVFAHHKEQAVTIGYRTNIKRGEDGSMAFSLKEYGKLAFVHNRKARPYTSTGTLRKDSSFSGALYSRICSAVKGYRRYFFKKRASDFVDEDTNLIK